MSAGLRVTYGERPPERVDQLGAFAKYGSLVIRSRSNSPLKLSGLKSSHLPVRSLSTLSRAALATFINNTTSKNNRVTHVINVAG